MDKTKKLIVPEVNGNELTIDDKIIANPRFGVDPKRRKNLKIIENNCKF